MLSRIKQNLEAFRAQHISGVPLDITEREATATTAYKHVRLTMHKPTHHFRAFQHALDEIFKIDARTVIDGKTTRVYIAFSEKDKELDLKLENKMLVRKLGVRYRDRISSNRNLRSALQELLPHSNVHLQYEGLAINPSSELAKFVIQLFKDRGDLIREKDFQLVISLRNPIDENERNRIVAAIRNKQLEIVPPKILSRSSTAKASAFSSSARIHGTLAKLKATVEPLMRDVQASDPALIAEIMEKVLRNSNSRDENFKHFISMFSHDEEVLKDVIKLIKQPIVNYLSQKSHREYDIIVNQLSSFIPESLQGMFKLQFVSLFGNQSVTVPKAKSTATTVLSLAKIAEAANGSIPDLEVATFSEESMSRYTGFSRS